MELNMFRVQSLGRLKCDAEDMAPTVRDIATLARVSIATVSRVLNGKANVSPQTRQSVESAMRQTGYTPNVAAIRMAGLSAVKRRSKQTVSPSGR
jgi:DNA-binding LacI/PurR family transcriptional regulator